MATHAIDVLVENYFDGATSIKRDVGVVYNNTKSSTHKACGHYKASNGYNSDISHFNDSLGEAKRNACSKHYHDDSHDMSSSFRPPSNCGRQSLSWKLMAMMGSVRAVGRKEIMTFVLLLHTFMIDMSLIIMVTHVESLLKIILVVVNLQVEVLVIISESLL